MNRYIKIGEAAKVLGVSVQTLRRWELLGTLIPDRKSSGGTRYYNLDRLLGVKNVESDLTFAYARVSSEEELAKDVLEIITVFSARLYGARSRKNKKLLEAAKVLIKDD